MKRNIRKATIDDIPFIVHMLASDKLGTLRENYRIPLPKKYYQAFENIVSDYNQELVVMTTESSDIIGTLQLSFIQYLTYQGGIRAQIEAVRVHHDHRGRSIGQELIEWAIERARKKGAPCRSTYHRQKAS